MIRKTLLAAIAGVAVLGLAACSEPAEVDPPEQGSIQDDMQLAYTWPFEDEFTSLGWTLEEGGYASPDGACFVRLVSLAGGVTEGENDESETALQRESLLAEVGEDAVQGEVTVPVRNEDTTWQFESLAYTGPADTENSLSLYRYSAVGGVLYLGITTCQTDLADAGEVTQELIDEEAIILLPASELG